MQLGPLFRLDVALTLDLDTCHWVTPTFPFLGLRCTNFNSKNGRQSALHADYIATFRIKIGAHPNNPKTVFTLLRQLVVAHPWHSSAAPAPPHLPRCPSRKHIYLCVSPIWLYDYLTIRLGGGGVFPIITFVFWVLGSRGAIIWEQGSYYFSSRRRCAQ